MTTEAEILSQHQAQLRIAYEACHALKMNAVESMPRGFRYQQLLDANKKLEGTCRQMFHWRGDNAHWVRLAAIYAQASKLAARLLLREKWTGFAELAKVYELGVRRVDDLASRPTGRSLDKLILPGRIDGWYDPKAPMLLQ
jgi:hypothetical protein